MDTHGEQRCPDCDSYYNSYEEDTHVFSFGPKKIQLSCLVERWKCEDCGYMWMDGYQGAKIDAAISKYLLEKLG